MYRLRVIIRVRGVIGRTVQKSLFNTKLLFISYGLTYL